jgi:PAS domain S-box-containing protein
MGNQKLNPSSARAAVIEETTATSASGSRSGSLPNFLPVASWQTAFDAMADPAWLMDLSGCIQQCNQAAQQLFGGPIVGRRCWELVHGTAERIASCPFPGMCQSCGRTVAEVLVQDRWFQISVDPLWDGQGTVSGALHIMRDVTRQKLAQTKLERDHETLERRMVTRTADLARANQAWFESDAAFRGYFENVAVGAAQMDAHGHFIRVNDCFCRITGYSRTELLHGMGPLDLDHPDDRDSDREKISQFVNQGEIYQTEKRYWTKDGRVIWVQVASRGITDAAGRFLYSAAVIEDITQRKEAEAALELERAKLAAVIENLPVGVGISDAQGATIFLNQAGLQLHGFEPARDKLLSSVDHAEQIEWRHLDGRLMPVEEWPVSRARRGEFVRNYEARLKNRRTAAERVITSTTVPIRNHDGAASLIVHVMQDITGLRVAEQRIARCRRTRDILSGVDHAMAHIQNQKRLLAECCRVAVEKGGFKLACVSLISPKGCLYRVARAGESGRLDGYRAVVQRAFKGRGLADAARRENRPVIIEDIAADPRAKAWREPARRFLLATAAAFPIRIGKKCVGFLQVYAGHDHRFDQDERDLLTQVCEEMAFALAARDIAAKRRCAGQQLRKSEHELQEFFTNSPVGLLWVDPAGRILRANKAQLELFGVNQAKRVLNRLIGDFLVHPAGAAVILDILAVGEVVENFHARLRQPDGNLIHVLINAAGVRDGSRLLHSHWFIRDITRRVELEREVLAASEEERRKLGQDLHDDLCQQLTGIQYLSDALARNMADLPGAPVNEAREIAQLARNTVKQARDMARGLSPLKLDAEGLMEGLQALAVHAQSVFRRECHFACHAPVLIADSTVALHLYRIAQEAVHNAVKHGRAGRIDISLAAAGDKVLLAVKDDGVGLPPKIKPHQGMGLRVMQYRAGLIDGSLVVQRRDDGGTEVVCSVHDGLLSPAKRRRR